MSKPRLLAGVVGSPIAHSLSPVNHGEWLRRAGVAAEYRAIEVAPGYDGFAKAMDELRNQGFAGVNVTIPHKENALRYADEASDAARAVGAANMLTFENSRTSAENSDITGFRDMALEAGLAPRSALILGAGGSARAVLYALAQQPFEAKCILANRTRARADEIAGIGGARVIDWEDRLKAARDCDLLVNTTPLGMTGQAPLKFEVTALPEGAAVVDIVYAPLETDLLRDAKARGLKAVSGLSMLMHQAAPGFQAWFGAAPRVDDELRALLIRKLKERSAA